MFIQKLCYCFFIFSLPLLSLPKLLKFPFLCLFISVHCLAMVICIYQKGVIRKTVVLFAKIILVKNNFLRFVVLKEEPRMFVT